MTEARSINRFRLAVIIVLTAAIALASVWIVEVMRRTAEDDQANRPAGEPDFYVEKFNFVKTSPTGQVRVGWEVMPGGAGEQLLMDWQESGGPKVSPPGRHGWFRRYRRRSHR